jgi:hypothetical protein
MDKCMHACMMRQVQLACAPGAKQVTYGSVASLAKTCIDLGGTGDLDNHTDANPYGRTHTPRGRMMKGGGRIHDERLAREACWKVERIPPSHTRE